MSPFAVTVTSKTRALWICFCTSLRGTRSTGYLELGSQGLTLSTEADTCEAKYLCLIINYRCGFIVIGTLGLAATKEAKTYIGAFLNFLTPLEVEAEDGLPPLRDSSTLEPECLDT